MSQSPVRILATWLARDLEDLGWKKPLVTAASFLAHSFASPHPLALSQDGSAYMSDLALVDNGSLTSMASAHAIVGLASRA